MFGSIRKIYPLQNEGVTLEIVLVMGPVESLRVVQQTGPDYWNLIRHSTLLPSLIVIPRHLSYTTLNTYIHSISKYIRTIHRWYMYVHIYNTSTINIPTTTTTTRSSALSSYSTHFMHQDNGHTCGFIDLNLHVRTYVKTFTNFIEK